MYNHSLHDKYAYMSLEMFVQGLQFIEQSLLGPITGILALQELHKGHEYLGAAEISRKKRQFSYQFNLLRQNRRTPEARRDKEGKTEHYMEENSGGLVMEVSGYLSSRIPTITSESDTHLSSILIKGTFPSGFMSKNLSNNLSCFISSECYNSQKLNIRDQAVKGKIRQSIRIQNKNITWIIKKGNQHFLCLLVCPFWFSISKYLSFSDIPDFKVLLVKESLNFIRCFTVFYRIRVENLSPFIWKAGNYPSQSLLGNRTTKQSTPSSTFSNIFHLSISAKTHPKHIVTKHGFRLFLQYLSGGVGGVGGVVGGAGEPTWIMLRSHHTGLTLKNHPH